MDISLHNKAVFCRTGYRLGLTLARYFGTLNHPPEVSKVSEVKCTLYSKRTPRII